MRQELVTLDVRDDILHVNSPGVRAQRFAQLDEVAAGVSFLLSDAGAGITGTTITIDGGSTA